MYVPQPFTLSVAQLTTVALPSSGGNKTGAAIAATLFEDQRGGFRYTATTIRARRRAPSPTRPHPTTINAHVAGSGTARAAKVMLLPTVATLLGTFPV